MALIENLVVALGLQSSQFSAGMKGAGKDLTDFEKHVAGIQTAMWGMAKGVVGMAVAFLGVKNVIENLSSAMNRMFGQAMSAAKLGVAVDDFTGLAYAVGSVGIETEKFDTAMQKMLVTISNAAEGDDSARGSLLRLGVSIDRIKNAGFVEQLKMFADGFGKLKNSAERMDLARNLFGRGGAGFLNVLELGSAGIQKLLDRAKFLGVLLSTQDISKILNLRNAWYDLGQSMHGVWNTILITNAETFTVIFKELADAIARSRIGISSFFKDISGGAWDAVTPMGILYSIVMEMVDAFKLMMYETAAWESSLTAMSAWMQGYSKEDQDFFTRLAKHYEQLAEKASQQMIAGATGGYIDRIRNMIKMLKESNITGKEGEYLGGGSEKVRPGAFHQGSKEAAEAAAKAGASDRGVEAQIQSVLKLTDLNKKADAINAKMLAISGALGLDAGIV